MINTNKKGFTLVELIVVITILAILGTIGFISLQGYSSASRDSKRITDLGQVRTGIQLYQAKEGIVPEPNDSITVGSGSTIYTIQGYAGTGTLRDIKVNDDAKDPLEENYYTYTTNGSKTKFQLLTLLENNNTAYNNILPTTYANYETRESYSIGDQLGTLLEPTTNIPLQELGNDIDLSVDTTEYIPVFSREDNNTKYSGLSLAQEMENRIGSTTCLTSGNCEGPEKYSFLSNHYGSITFVLRLYKDGNGDDSDSEYLSICSEVGLSPLTSENYLNSGDSHNKNGNNSNVDDIYISNFVQQLSDKGINLSPKGLVYHTNPSNYTCRAWYNPDEGGCGVSKWSTQSCNNSGYGYCRNSDNQAHSLDWSIAYCK